jgi:predicted CXXCH cytochrome family protein
MLYSGNRGIGVRNHMLRWRLERVFLILMAGIVWTGNASSAQKHECAYCHITSEKTGQQQLKAPLSGLCLGCHPDRSSPNEHGVDIVPSMKVTKLPLSKEGKITCATCHDPHEMSGYPMLLRASPAELCSKCHFRESYSPD